MRQPQQQIGGDPAFSAKTCPSTQRKAWQEAFLFGMAH
jgi:hypothetical protein